MIFLLVLAAVVAGAPLIAAVLVSIESVREDTAKSLAGRPPGPLAAAARRLLQARVGGMGSLKPPLRARRPVADRRSHRRQRANRTAPLGAPQWRADDEQPGHSDTAPAPSARRARPVAALSIRRPPAG